MNNLRKVVMQLCPSGNCTYDLLIASPTAYRYVTVSPAVVYCDILSWAQPMGVGGPDLLIIWTDPQLFT